MPNKKKFPTTILAFILVFFIGVFIVYTMQNSSDTLPIYNPADINPHLVDEGVRDVDRNHRIQSFTLVNQLGDTIDESTFDGKIYVADFFFTRCMGICPKMTKQMDRAAKELKAENNIIELNSIILRELADLENELDTLRQRMILQDLIPADAKGFTKTVAAIS